MLTIENLARFQFAMTTIFHFFFVPLSVGTVFMTVLMETIYVKTGDEKWKKRTKFFGSIMLLSFAVGVVTGIIQEFQFGMNWSDYSRYVGDIFGAPLAVEALLAFFLESTLKPSFLSIFSAFDISIPDTSGTSISFDELSFGKTIIIRINAFIGCVFPIPTI